MSGGERGEERILPERVQRYFAHAIARGAPNVDAVRLRMSGELRLNGRWLPFSASQWLAPQRGFDWRATVRMGPLHITGFDRYGNGCGEMRWRLFGLIPLLHSTGPDIDRSARGRVVAEAMWAPTALLPQHGVSWSEGEAGWLRARWTIDGEEDELRLEVDHTGCVRRITTTRWGNPDGQGWRAVPFGGQVEAEGTFQGLTIPSRVSGGWWFDTVRYSQDGAVFRAVIEDLTAA